MISGFTFMTLSAACAKEHVQILSRSTGKERDTESGNDYFGARYHASTIGRMMRLDRMNVIATRHYDDPRSPQASPPGDRAPRQPHYGPILSRMLKKLEVVEKSA